MAAVDDAANKSQPLANIGPITANVIFRISSEKSIHALGLGESFVEKFRTKT